MGILNVIPRSPSNYSLYLRKGHRKLSGHFSHACAVSKCLSHCQNLFIGEHGSWMEFATWHDTFSHGSHKCWPGMSGILFRRNIFKIFRDAVSTIGILVIDLLPGWLRANKCLGNKSVNIKALRSYFHGKAHLRISVFSVHGGTQHFADLRPHFWSGSSYFSKITSLVISRESWDFFPNFNHRVRIS